MAVDQLSLSWWLLSVLCQASKLQLSIPYRYASSAGNTHIRILLLSSHSALQVFAQRRPIFHRLLDFEDEVFAIITAALDRQSLANGSSSFAESLYGLRRHAVKGKSKPKALLSPQAQYSTLLCLVSMICYAVSCSCRHPVLLNV